MVYIVVDIRFMFKRNPFNSQQAHITPSQDANCAKLVKYIETHPQDFIVVNPITSIKYVSIVSPNDLKILDGVKNPCKHHAIDEYQTISSNIKRFMKATGMPLSKDLKAWIGDFNPSTAVMYGGAANVIEEEVVENDGGEEDEEEPVGEIVVPEFVTFLEDNNDANAMSSITIGMNYDSSNDKKLDYTEICNICLSIAKTYNNNNNNMKDPAIVAIENKRRRDLLNKIAKYRRNREIAAVCSDDDLTKLTIEQLETVYAECESKFGQLKLKDVSRQILNIGSKAYDMILPLGIPIGKGRHITFNGIGDEIIKELHNSTSAVGLAYDNFIQKHNIHISDEMSIISAIANIFIKNIHVTHDAEGDDEEVEADEEEEEAEEEEELEEV